LGPVQLYVAPGIADADKFKALPSHNGPLFVINGAGGVGFMITASEDGVVLEQPFTVTDAWYTPALPGETFETTGFCCDDVKPLGPVQLYSAPGVDEAFNNMDAPEQIGAFEDNIGAAGIKFTTTF